MSLFIFRDVVKYHILPFVYLSDVFQLFRNVYNHDLYEMVITELQQRCPGEILIRDTEHNLIQYLNFAEHTKIRKRNLSGHLRYRRQYPEKFRILSNYYHIRPLVLYCVDPIISSYQYNGQLIKLILKFYKIGDIPHFGFTSKNKNPYGFINTSINARRRLISKKNHSDYYCYYCDELIFEFHGLNAVKVKKKFLTRSNMVHSFRIDNHSSNEQGFQTVNARVKNVLRDRAIVFASNYYINEQNYNYFDCDFNFPGQIPCIITKILDAIYFGNINKLLKKNKYAPNRVYKVYNVNKYF